MKNNQKFAKEAKKRRTDNADSKVKNSVQLLFAVGDAAMNSKSELEAREGKRKEKVKSTANLLSQRNENRVQITT